MLKNILIVSFGSAVGGALRYAASLLMRWSGNGFPWGTFAVNLAGCLLIGCLAGVFSRYTSQSLHLLLTVGFCGGFTTFSTFSRESLALLQSGQWWPLVTYVILSVVLGIALTALGYVLTK